MIPVTCPACKQKSLKYDVAYIFCTSCKIYRRPLHWWENILVWTVDKQWWWRVPIVAWFIYILVQNIVDPMSALDRFTNPLSGLDLGIHELGHMLFQPFGEFMHIAGGTILQCLFPILAILGCLQKRWFFGACLCIAWLGINFFDVAVYAGDAQSRVLPLASGGAGLYEQDPGELDKIYDQTHDWYQLLSRTGHLGSDLEIAHGLRVAGTVTMVAGISLAIFLILNMIYRTRWRRYQSTPQP